MSRREALRQGVRASAGLAVSGLLGTPCGARAQDTRRNVKAIPGSGELLPIIGLGTASSFSRAAGDVGQHPRLRNTLRRFLELGATVVDTAPNYGRSEEVLGRLLREIGRSSDAFFATKIAEADGRPDGIAQVEESVTRVRPGAVDLDQVHNLVDWRNQLAVLREAKAERVVRYTGVTTYRDEQYAELETIMRTEELDFVQVDYSIANRGAEDRILPLARDRGLAVIANMPFGNGRLFRAVEGREAPDWLSAFGATSWAQLFLRWIVSHPSVTVTIPATTNPAHVEENVTAGWGRLPTPGERNEMAARLERAGLA